MKKLYDENNLETKYAYHDNVIFCVKSMKQHWDYRNHLKVIKNINSVHLKKIYNIWYEDGMTFYLEEYISAQKTTQISNEGVKKELIYKYINQLLEAIKVFHQYGIIHKDIKPDNILIDRNDNVVLIDYDIIRKPSDFYIKVSDTTLNGTKGFL